MSINPGINKWLLFALLVVSLLQIRCNKDEAKTLFDVVYVLPFELPAGLNTVQTHFIEFNKFPTGYEALLAQHQLTAEQVARIEPFSGLLEVVLVPQGLSFIREIFVEFLDGNNQYECFYTPNVPLNAGTQVTLVGTIADFKSILQESAMNIRIGFRLRETSPSSLPCTLRLIFKAKA